MRQIVRCVIDRAGSVRLIDVPKPVCSSNEIIVKNEFSLISIGTETQMAKMDTAGAVKTTLKDKRLKNTLFNMIKTMKPAEFLNIVREELTKGYPMGYSGSGIVEEIGEQVEGVNVGDRVSYAGSGHADFVKVPKNLFVKLPPNVSYQDGAFVTLGSIAMQGIRQGKLGLGETVVVYGLGLVGLLTTQILNAYGFKVIGLDIEDEKIKSALKFGAEACFDANSGNDIINEQISKITGGYGADCVIICAANMKDSSIVNHAAELCRPKGRIVIVGKVGLNLDRNEIYNKELELTISCSYGPGRHDPQYEVDGIDYPYGYVRWTENRNMLEFLDLINRKKVKIESFISDIVDVDLTEETYKRMKHDDYYNPVGVLIKYNNKENNKKSYSVNKKIRSYNKDKVNIGIIGAGNYSRTVILPLLHRQEEYNIVALADNKGSMAKQLGEKYNVNFISTDYNKLLDNKNIDTVYIATRHDTHQSIACESLKANKNVICEKPAAMNIEELDELMRCIHESRKIFHVGYNRRFSDFAKKAKSLISGKALISIVVNNKKMNTNAWQLDPNLGGGRIIGESCHFFDLINYLINEKPLSIYATSIIKNNDSIISSNNFSINICYKSGSIGRILYSDLGHTTYPKEIISIYSNNTIIEINDFKSIKVYGDSKFFKKLRYIDKGHRNQYTIFAKDIINGPADSLPSTDDYYFASLMPLKTIESIKTNKVVTL